MKTKAQLSAEIAAQIDQFTANGGTIEQVPYDPSAEHLDYGGQGKWERMGDPIMDDVEVTKYGLIPQVLLDMEWNDDVPVDDAKHDADYDMMRDDSEWFNPSDLDEWE